MRELMEDVGTSSQQVAALRATVVLSPMIFAFALVMTGTTTVWAMLVLALLGVTAAVNPHSGVPATVMVYLLAVWATGVEALWTPWTLVATGCLTVFHISCSLLASVPAPAGLPLGLFVRYLGRLGVVMAVATVLFGVGVALQLVDLPGGLVAGASALLVLAAALAVHYRAVARGSH